MNAAVYVDFENLYLSLKNRYATTGLRTRELSLHILEGMLAKLRENGHPIVLGRSYAGFDTYPGVEVAHDLALMGLDPQYVLISHTGKNSADVQLALDVARVLYRRADIGLVVIVSGDRDFIPLARQVLEEGRDLRVVAIPDTTSGDLRARVGEARFWNALQWLDNRLEGHDKSATSPAAPAKHGGQRVDAPSHGVPEVDGNGAGGSHTGNGSGGHDGTETGAGTHDAPPSIAPLPITGLTRDPSADPSLAPGTATALSSSAVGGGVGHGPHLHRETHGPQIVGRVPVTWQVQRPSTAVDLEEDLMQCMDLLVRAQIRHNSPDIWLSPFLKGAMSQHFSHMVHPERRALINELRNRGVIRVEERENAYADHPYSVIVIEESHPLAQAARARVLRGAKG